MKLVEPEVRLIARPEIDWTGLKKYLDSVGADTGTDSWVYRRYWGEATKDAELLVETGGKVCYRSWEPGLNPNVSRVRTDQAEYLENILSSGHGSVLEHANFTFAFRHVSRVLTHELVRHRAGTAISQESMRYVRLDEIPIWVPEWARNDRELMDVIQSHLHREEEFLWWLNNWFDRKNPNPDFAKKKHFTSFMRRFVPGGVATDLIWTANVRALRHIIESRTAPGAEEEIRLVFAEVARIMKIECPMLFGDFTGMPDGTWVPKWSKV